MGHSTYLHGLLSDPGRVDPVAAIWAFDFFASSTHNACGVFSLSPIRIVANLNAKSISGDNNV